MRTKLTEKKLQNKNQRRYFIKKMDYLCLPPCNASHRAFHPASFSPKDLTNRPSRDGSHEQVMHFHELRLP